MKIERTWLLNCRKMHNIGNDIIGLSQTENYQSSLEFGSVGLGFVSCFLLFLWKNRLWCRKKNMTILIGCGLVKKKISNLRATSSSHAKSKILFWFWCFGQNHENSIHSPPFLSFCIFNRIDKTDYQYCLCAKMVFFLIWSIDGFKVSIKLMYFLIVRFSISWDIRFSLRLHCVRIVCIIIAIDSLYIMPWAPCTLNVRILYVYEMQNWRINRK